MNRHPSCEEVQFLASEVALGVASGDERAIVLAHARSCPDCRRIFEEMSQTADALLLLGPLTEPASGFESKVLARMQATPRSASRTRARLIAAALVSLVVTGSAAFWITADDRKVASYYRDALAEANGRYFGVVPLESDDGTRAGHLFAYEGRPTWVFLIFTTPLAPGRYDAELEEPGGAIRSLGSFEIATGDVTWGRDLPVGLRSVRTVRVLDDEGAIAVSARFPAR
jgi:hypothetical protein